MNSREEFLKTCDLNDFEYYRLHDALASTVFLNSNISPTIEQKKALFMMLPSTIIDLGFTWGFTDTVVGDEIYQFIEENMSIVKERLGLPDN